MQHAGDRAARAGADIGGSARDRASGAHAAEQPRRRYWRRPARPVRSWSDAPAGHAVGDDGGKQAIRSRPEARRRWHREARPATCPSDEGGQSAPAGMRGMPPKREPMVSTARRTQPRRDRRHATAISMPGQFGRSVFRPDDECDGQRRSATVAGLNRGEALPDAPSFANERRRLDASSVEPEKIA